MLLCVHCSLCLSSSRLPATRSYTFTVGAAQSIRVEQQPVILLQLLIEGQLTVPPLLLRLGCHSDTKPKQSNELMLSSVCVCVNDVLYCRWLRSNTAAPLHQSPALLLVELCVEGLLCCSLLAVHCLACCLFGAEHERRD